MLDLSRFTPQSLSTDPYRWAFIDRVFSPEDSRALVETFPTDHFKTVSGYDGEKGYQYDARSLAAMGANVPTFPNDLSPQWLLLAEELLSPQYREAMSLLTGVDLQELRIE